MAFDPDKYLQSKRIAQLPAVEMEPAEDKLDLGDVAAMVGQGATFGFGDELLGAIKAAKDIALTDKELSDLPELYRQRQKEEEAKYEALSEAHPGMALAGELAGGFLIPGGFLAKGGLKGATAMQKALEAAKMGAKVGAIAGAGTSKADVSDIKALGKDVLRGATGGAVLGGGLSAAGSAISKGAKTVPEQLRKLGPLGENLIRAFEEERAGRGFVSPESEQRITKAAKEASEELSGKLVEPSRDVTKEITEYLAQAGEAGGKVVPEKEGELTYKLGELLKNVQGEKLSEEKNIYDTFLLRSKRNAINKQLKAGKITQEAADAAIKQLEANKPLKKTAITPAIEALQSELGMDVGSVQHPLTKLSEDIQRLIKGELSPQEAINLSKVLGGEFYGGGPEASEQLRKLIPSGLTEQLKQAGYKAADVAMGQTGDEAANILSGSGKLLQKFEDVRRLVPETILNKGELEKYSDVLLRKFGSGEQGLKAAETELNNQIKNHIIEKLSDPSTTGDQMRDTMLTLKERIGELNTKYPELKLNLDDVITKVKQAAQDKTIRAKIMTKHGEKDSISGLTGKLLDWSGYGGAAVAGKVTGSVEKKLGSFNNFITRASDATLLPIAKQLQSTPGVSHIGAALEGAINNKSVAAKNAAIFSIMQNPDARQAVSDLGFATEQE